PPPASPPVMMPPPPMMPPLHPLAAVHPPPQQPIRPPSPPAMQPLPGMQPPAMQPPAMQPLAMQPLAMQPPAMQPPANHPAWALPGQLPVDSAPPHAAYDRPAARRNAPAPRARVRARQPPLSPWIMVGALAMAILAFSVTRACMHSAASRPAAESSR
ncbi:MAG TPA: hypothetical protein VGD80_41140, partial [Kofleriaceae bacterium]